MRIKKKIDSNWKFMRGDLSPHTDADEWGAAKGRAFSFGATAMDFDDSGWKDVTIPHDFVMEGDYTRKKNEAMSEINQIPAMESIDSRHFAGGSLETGVAWYRKHFALPKEQKEQRIYLHFDGVFRNSTIYLNEYFVGKHTSGYTSFFFDVTDFVQFGKENLLAVRVDATGREGWWYEGGGIYRHVWLEITDAVHTAPWGITVLAEPNSTFENASVKITTEVCSKLEGDCNIAIEQTILDSEGKVVGNNTIDGIVKGWNTTMYDQQIELEQIHLWSLEQPYLYTVKTSLYRNGEQIECTQTSFGIRTIQLDANKGVFLNGKRIKVKGLCAHQDHAGVGIAMPESVMEYRLKKIKQMGANAFRCSHNPPAPEFLETCDRLGILVMDETRETSSAGEYLGQLRDMVRRDRNHPSIYLWCIGNEEVFLQPRPEAARIVHSMQMEVKKFDQTRPVTMGGCLWNPNAKPGEEIDMMAAISNLLGSLDTAGFNYSPDHWDEYHETNPKQPMIITEATSNSGTRGCYETNPYTGGYYVFDQKNSEKEIRKGAAQNRECAENMWIDYAHREYLCGYFVWTAFDYRGEPSPMPYPAISSQFGLMDTCGFEKDEFYYYQSWWTDQPILHLFPHWNWRGKEGCPVSVYCYSNLEEVELFVNGQSQGRKKMKKNWHLEWKNVIYEPGILSAVGYQDGKKVMEESIQTTGAPYRIQLSSDRTVLAADGEEVAIINVSVTDRENRVVPTAENQIFFEVEGAGVLVGTGNGNPGSHESEKLPLRRAFGGLCQLLVKSKRETGTITVKASGADLYGAECVLQVKGGQKENETAFIGTSK